MRRLKIAGRFFRLDSDTARLVAADALVDAGRLGEAIMLRTPAPVDVVDNRVVLLTDAGDPVFPASVFVDTREQLPFAFNGIPADGFDGRPWHVQTHRQGIPSGDYSLDGYASRVAVERKSAADLFGTVGQGRDRFTRELQRLAEFQFAAVVVEADWATLLARPPKHSRLSVKTVYRSVLAWQQRYPRVHWWFCPDRDFAEVTTFRILERFLREQCG